VRDVQGQINQYLELGVHELVGVSAEVFREAAPAGESGARVVAHPNFVSAESLATLMIRDGKPGFVVEDLTDLADFAGIPEVDIPTKPLYVVTDPRRGDELRNWSPNEDLPELLLPSRLVLGGKPAYWLGFASAAGRSSSGADSPRAE
jgi:hypothetical protein